MKKLIRWLIRCSCAASLFVTISSGQCLAADEPSPPIVRFGPTMFGDFPVKEPFVPVRRGAFKIAENESPAPQDRVYVNYNYFNDIKRDLLFGGHEDVH